MICNLQRIEVLIAPSSQSPHNQPHSLKELLTLERVPPLDNRFVYAERWLEGTSPIWLTRETDCKLVGRGTPQTCAPTWANKKLACRIISLSPRCRSIRSSRVSKCQHQIINLSRALVDTVLTPYYSNSTLSSLSISHYVKLWDIQLKPLLCCTTQSAYLDLKKRY